MNTILLQLQLFQYFHYILPLHLYGPRVQFLLKSFQPLIISSSGYCTCIVISLLTITMLTVVQAIQILKFAPFLLQQLTYSSPFFIHLHLYC